MNRARSRSPRRLSDEAQLLQRLANPELPPGTSDAERAAAMADAAAEVEQAAVVMGGRWVEAYKELHPDWEPPLTETELQFKMLQLVYLTLNDVELFTPEEARRRVLRVLHAMRMDLGWGWAAPQQQPTTHPSRPFTGQGRRLDEQYYRMQMILTSKATPEPCLVCRLRIVQNSVNSAADNTSEQFVQYRQ